MNKKLVYGGILIAIVLAIGGYFFPNVVSDTLGAATPGTRFPHGVTIGLPASSPTNIGYVKSGTCNASFSGTSLSASSTGQFFCSAPGVLSGDIVMVQLPAGAGLNAQGAGSIYGGFSTAGTYATTSDIIGFNIWNGTGAATTTFTQATTSIQYMILRVQ